jgi:hypothetical protein
MGWAVKQDAKTETDKKEQEMDDTTIVYPELSVLVRRHLAWYTETKVES